MPRKPGPTKSKKEKPEKKKEIVKYIDGLRGVSEVVEVELSQIDLENDPYQFRFKASPGDLIASLKTLGQQDPIILTGKSAPYKIVDGHRRIKAFQKLGWEKIKAIVRQLTTEDASTISFVRNVKRKNLSLMEKANAIYEYHENKSKTVPDIAELLGVSERQIKRYLELAKFPKFIRDAVDQEVIGMAHARMLAKLPPAEAQGLLKQLQKKELTLRNMIRQAKAHKPSLKILQAQEGGFRLFPFRFDKAKTPADQKKHMIEALKQALAVLEKA
jgi:ParB/RepB/Spo0J family partition protein